MSTIWIIGALITAVSAIVYGAYNRLRAARLEAIIIERKVKSAEMRADIERVTKDIKEKKIEYIKAKRKLELLRDPDDDGPGSAA